MNKLHDDDDAQPTGPTTLSFHSKGRTLSRGISQFDKNKGLHQIKTRVSYPVQKEVTDSPLMSPPTCSSKIPTPYKSDVPPSPFNRFVSCLLNKGLLMASRPEKKKTTTSIRAPLLPYSPPPSPPPSTLPPPPTISLVEELFGPRKPPNQTFSSSSLVGGGSRGSTVGNSYDISEQTLFIPEDEDDESIVGPSQYFSELGVYYGGREYVKTKYNDPKLKKPTKPADIDESDGKADRGDWWRGSFYY